MYIHNLLHTILFILNQNCMKWHDYQYKLMIFGQKRRSSIKICHYQYIQSQKYWVGTRGVTLNIDQKNKKSQIIALFLLMKYENANPWFCSKCSPSLAGKLWSCNFSVLLKGQIFWRICSVFPAIFAAILLLNVGGICNYGNYITVMTFRKKKSEKIARKRKIKEIF